MINLGRPIVVGAFLLLGACGLTPQGDAFRSAVADRGAKAYDEGLINAEWFVCKAASVGSVERRYGTSKELADAWRALCHSDANGAIVVAPGE